MNKFLLTLLFVQSLAWASAATEIDHEKRVDVLHEIRKALITANVTAQDAPIMIAEPARSFYHFGAVLDQDFKVVALTPGSDAAKADVRVGDMIKAINHQEVNKSSLADILAQMNDLQEGTTLAIEVQRDNKLKTLQSPVTRKTLPGWRLELVEDSGQAPDTPLTMGCGFVSVFYNPPISMHRHTVMINEIKDIGFKGKLTETKREQVFRLPAGEVEIVVQELISSDSIRRNRGDSRIRQYNSIKTMTLVVEPDKVYHLAAEYFSDRREREDADDYWQPIVWKTTERSCE
ncbi:PDZ domain-containing protein [Arsukibacterium tuosuense]|uniref:PDZ domain-containing protein n=1 Tax=Arsukibacterium tuosuense TaxID=1323745 RepID=A0A285IPA8_9GAMM|nr:PDZ domain-containing protein [Arsukibacterium tuosuense]SNY48791.1 PDZ domain-containing protein [Arsukibacterium tuosuense]